MQQLGSDIVRYGWAWSEVDDACADIDCKGHGQCRVFQDGGYLVDGSTRVERSGDLDVYDSHEFNNHGIDMCKEFRRRALANCVSSSSRALASDPRERLSKCMSYFDHLAGLVKFNSHKTPTSFKPVFNKHWPESLIDDMISREIAVLACTARTCVRPSCAEADTEQKPEGMPKCSHSMFKY